jgi:hypothetical protein
MLQNSHLGGEALLYYNSIPLMPIEPLFRCYHYNWQYEFDSGAQEQRKSWTSCLARFIKSQLARFR